MGMPFDAFCKLWLSRHIEFGGWIDHTKGWYHDYQQSYNKDWMLWISFEELVGKPIVSIQRIANFIGVDVESDTTLVERVAHGCRFENVKKAAQTSLDNGMQGDIAHLRKGTKGDWRNHFSEKLFTEFENEIRRQFDADEDNSWLKYDIGEGMYWKPAYDHS